MLYLFQGLNMKVLWCFFTTQLYSKDIKVNRRTSISLVYQEIRTAHFIRDIYSSVRGAESKNILLEYGNMAGLDLQECKADFFNH